MEDELKYEWISLHIYYASFNKLLTECIDPLVNSELFGEIESYFFIRYGEQGPHIRIRIKADENTGIKMYKYIQSYITEYPSFRSEYYGNEGWYPNNSIQVIPYEPEYDRYGGKEGMVVSEMLFRYSSDTVLSYLRGGLLKDYNNAIHISIKMHISFAYTVCNKDLNKAIKFFEYIYTAWADSNEKADNAFVEMYNSQKPVLNELIFYLWSALQNGCVDNYLSLWCSRASEVCTLLRYSFKENVITYNASIAYPQWYLLQSHIHMTNNRLGIKNIDENLIVYYMLNSLIEIKRKYEE